MQANHPVPISTFQYYVWKLKNVPTPVLLLLSAAFATIIYFFPQRPLELVKEWYPGSVREAQPTIQVTLPTHTPVPTVTELPPAPPSAPQQEPVSQPEPIVGVA